MDNKTIKDSNFNMDIRPEQEAAALPSSIEVSEQTSAVVELTTEGEELPNLGATPARINHEKCAGEQRKKEKVLRSYEEISAELSDTEAKNITSIDRYIGLLVELKAIKDLTEDQIQFFFASVNELIEDAWAPFLAKAATQFSPSKIGNDYLIAKEILRCCEDILNSCGLSMDDVAKASEAFREKKDEKYIKSFLAFADKLNPNVNSPDGAMLHKITPQELACVAFVCFNFASREYSPSALEPLILIDRAIAEYFAKPVLKEHAGKTLGSVLASKVFSPKKISELTYLYSGTSETIKQQADKIETLKTESSNLRARNSSLSAELDKWKGDHADLVAHIAELESENARYRQERADAESRLEYEKNRYERQMQTKEAGLAEQLSGDIELEIQAIRETIEFIDEDNQRRIRRRLQRIDDILHEFGGESDA